MKRVWALRKARGNFVGYTKGRRLGPHSSEWKAKMSALAKEKGYQPPVETRFKPGVPTRLGVILTEEHKQKIRQSNLGKHTPAIIVRGPEHPNWRGGRSPLHAQIRGCFKYRQWRSDVFTRDNFACVICGDSTGGNLNADHIEPFIFILTKHNISTIEMALACEVLWNINNGQTLCETCHRQTPTYGEGAKTYTLEQLFDVV